MSNGISICRFGACILCSDTGVYLITEPAIGRLGGTTYIPAMSKRRYCCCPIGQLQEKQNMVMKTIGTKDSNTEDSSCVKIVEIMEDQKVLLLIL